MSYTDTDFSVLKAFAVNGASAVSTIEKFLGKESLKGSCDRLYSNKCIDRLPLAAVVYVITGKGRKLLEAREPGIFSGLKRAAIEYQPLVVKPSQVRPGSEDHLKCMSRRGDSFVSHRGPISLAGGE